jgi:hypothetical protein
MKKNLLFFTFLLATLFLMYSSCQEDIVPLKESWEKAIPHQEPPEGLFSIKAQDCGVCHQSHYEEWKLSTHAHAWTDLQFQAELRKETSPFLCINCHIPLQNQQEYIVSGLRGGDIYKPVKEKNPNFDPAFQMEGISCATCHVRDGAIIGTIGSDKAPHKVKKDPKFLNETLCISCHNATAVVTPELVCSFETGDEWKASPISGQKNCISCHMDTITRELMPGMGLRTSHRHWFAGSGIPKMKGVESKALIGMAFYDTSPKKLYSTNTEYEYQLRLVNEYAGHRLPTGDPERFYLIKISLIHEESGKIIKTVNERIGETWEWYPVAKKVADNNMNPGEERMYTLQSDLTEKGNYKVKAIVTKHRMDEKTAEYNKLGDEYPRMITVFEKEYDFVVK